MQLLISGGSHAARTDWAGYALLRDNVQHYLESASIKGEFKSIHALEKVVDGESGTLNALTLRREVQRAWLALRRLRLEHSAISLRTRSLLLGCPKPLVTATVVAKAADWDLPVAGTDEQPLGELLEGFVNAVLIATEGAREADDVEILCEDTSYAEPCANAALLE